MKLSDLSINDLSAIMANLSKRMSRLEEKSEENASLWEQLAFRRACVASEFTNRLDKIEYPLAPKVGHSERFWFSISDNGIQIWDKQTLFCKCEDSNKGAGDAIVLVKALNMFDKVQLIPK